MSWLPLSLASDHMFARTSPAGAIAGIRWSEHRRSTNRGLHHASLCFVGGCATAHVTWLVGGRPTAHLASGRPTAQVVSGCPTARFFSGRPTAHLVSGRPTAQVVSGCPTARVATDSPTAHLVSGSRTAQHVNRADSIVIGLLDVLEFEPLPGCGIRTLIHLIRLVCLKVQVARVR